MWDHCSVVSPLVWHRTQAVVGFVGSENLKLHGFTFGEREPASFYRRQSELSILPFFTSFWWANIHSLNLSWGEKMFFCKTRQQDFFKSWLLKSLDGESWSQRRCALTAAEETGPGTASRSFTPPVSSWAKYLDSRLLETFWKMNLIRKKGSK